MRGCQFRISPQYVRRMLTGMGKFTERLKSVLRHDDWSEVPDKQISRWEGEGGLVLPASKWRKRATRRSRTQDTRRDDGEGA